MLYQLSYDPEPRRTNLLGYYILIQVPVNGMASTTIRELGLQITLDDLSCCVSSCTTLRAVKLHTTQLTHLLYVVNLARSAPVVHGRPVTTHVLRRDATTTPITLVLVVHLRRFSRQSTLLDEPLPAPAVPLTTVVVRLVPLSTSPKWSVLVRA